MHQVMPHVQALIYATEQHDVIRRTIRKMIEYQNSLEERLDHGLGEMTSTRMIYLALSEHLGTTRMKTLEETGRVEFDGEVPVEHVREQPEVVLPMCTGI